MFGLPCDIDKFLKLDALIIEDCAQSLGVKYITASDITNIAVKELKNKFTNIKVENFDVSDKIPINLQSQKFDIILIFISSHPDLNISFNTRSR